MDKKVGVYICGGCGIGESVDTGKLEKLAARELKARVARVHPFLCGEEAVQAIRGDLASGAVNTAVIAACSARAKTEAFRFDPPAVVERVNLREHVAWCQPAGSEDTRMLAEDYLRMGAVRARKSECPEPVTEETSRTILVVGAGAAGISAALGAAMAGYDVVVVEKQSSIGGFAASLRERFPVSPNGETQADWLRSKIETLAYYPKVRVITSARVEKIEGQPGRFEVTIRTAPGICTIRAGAIVMATGWKSYGPEALSYLGYGASPDVITNVDLERMAASGEIVRPSDGKPVRDVVFVQCAGSRDKEHLSYCSTVCCVATLKHSLYIRRQNPSARVFIVYRDMRTPGHYEAFYRRVQDEPLNFFTKGDVTAVEKNGDGKLRVRVKGTAFGDEIALPADLVVLATGMVPNSADGEAIRALEDARAKAETAESEKQRAEAARRAEELKAHDGAAILNLTYRQGPDLPVLNNGFPDSHFICFPYETRRTGIYVAGTVRAPMDSTQAEADGEGAALKAIQCIELAAERRAVHPRAGDLSVPSFLLQRCTQCKRCTEECPFGALDEDAKGTPKPNLYRCRRCGICMGACPERIISFQNYSVDMIASMIKAIEVPEEDEDKPRVLVFMCENDAYPALDIAGFRRLHYDPSVRVIPLRCLGSLNIVWIADALSRGIDGVMLIGCKYGDDYQCHFIRGSELASRRMENVKETLQRLRLEPERLQMTELAINDYQALPALIDGFVDRIRKIGPNPYKGF